AQWVVYEANELPTAFTASPFVTASVTVAAQAPTPDQPVVDPQFSIIDDPANAGNKLMLFRILGSKNVTTGPTSQHQSYLFRQNFATNPTPAATVVVRAKGLTGHDRAFELDLDFGGFRETVYIINPTMNTSTGQMNTTGAFTFNVSRANTAMTAEQRAAVNEAPLNISPLDWHVYRFVKNGASIQMYIDENPTPFASATTTAGTNNYFRIGDGTSDRTNGMELDYIVWEPTGAFSPTEKPLPTTVILSSKGERTKINGLKVFPNPSADAVVVTHPAARKGATLEIFNLKGVKVSSIATDQNTSNTRFFLTNIQSGMYTIVYTDGVERITSRIVKQ
ncbi:MAG: T9SS type A sorting domain-containing protein, partial [Rufibacter sp.]